MDTAQTGIRAQDLANASFASVVLETLESHAPAKAGFLYAYRDTCPHLARTALIDTVLLARTLHPGLDSYRLDALVRHLRLPRTTRRHQATDDLKITAHLFRQLPGDAAPRRRFASLADLIHASGRLPKASQPHHSGPF